MTRSRETPRRLRRRRWNRGRPAPRSFFRSFIGSLVGSFMFASMCIYATHPVVRMCQISVDRRRHQSIGGDTPSIRGYRLKEYNRRWETSVDGRRGVRQSSVKATVKGPRPPTHTFEVHVPEKRVQQVDVRHPPQVALVLLPRVVRAAACMCTRVVPSPREKPRREGASFLLPTLSRSRLTRRRADEFLILLRAVVSRVV